MNPEKILCLGNYSKWIFTGDMTGILRQRGMFRELELKDDVYNVLFTIHPAYCIYNAEEGIPHLREDLKLFKDTEFEKEGENDWLFTEDEFKI